MYGLIAEDPSDIETLKVLIRRLLRNSTLRIEGKGYDGCGEMLRKGASQLRLLADLGCSRFIVCYDSDGDPPAERRREAIAKIIKPSGLKTTSCLVLVPVQEIEAFILADIQAVTQIIPSWKPEPILNPEQIRSPKEHLEKLSRDSKQRPRYAHATHNPQAAKYLDLEQVRQKCPSFRALIKFVVDHRRIKFPEQDYPGTHRKSIWAYTDRDDASQYVEQIATPHEWGEFIRYVSRLDIPANALLHLCGFGWGDFGELEKDLQDAQKAAAPKGGARKTIATLLNLAVTREDARYLGIEDGMQ
ncbi:MAG TPA: DUF4276 family protein [Gemmataceae bacterium]